MPFTRATPDSGMEAPATPAAQAGAQPDAASAAPAPAAQGGPALSPEPEWVKNIPGQAGAVGSLIGGLAPGVLGALAVGGEAGSGIGAPLAIPTAAATLAASQRGSMLGAGIGRSGGEIVRELINVYGGYDNVPKDMLNAALRVGEQGATGAATDVLFSRLGVPLMGKLGQGLLQLGGVHDAKAAAGLLEENAGYYAGRTGRWLEEHTPDFLRRPAEAVARGVSSGLQRLGGTPAQVAEERVAGTSPWATGRAKLEQRFAASAQESKGLVDKADQLSGGRVNVNVGAALERARQRAYQYADTHEPAVQTAREWIDGRVSQLAAERGSSISGGGAALPAQGVQRGLSVPYSWESQAAKDEAAALAQQYTFPVQGMGAPTASATPGGMPFGRAFDFLKAQNRAAGTAIDQRVGFEMPGLSAEFDNILREELRREIVSAAESVAPGMGTALNASLQRTSGLINTMAQMTEPAMAKQLMYGYEIPTARSAMRNSQGLLTRAGTIGGGVGLTSHYAGGLHPIEYGLAAAALSHPAVSSTIINSLLGPEARGLARLGLQTAIPAGAYAVPDVTSVSR